MLFAELSDSVYVLFAFIILLFIIGIGFLLFLSIRKTYKQERADEDVFSMDSEENTNSKNYFVSNSKIQSAMDEFARRYRFDNEMSLYLFSFDNMTSLRKSFGQKQSEKFLNILLRRVQDNLPTNSLIAEVGHDKFAILLRGRIPQNKIEKFVDGLINQIEKPIFIPNTDNGKIQIQCNFGVAVYPSAGTNSKELVKKADMALYKASQDLNNKYVIVTEDKSKTTNENFEYYREIREAMRNNEFTCNFQPIIDTKNNKIFGAEALVRWVHPTLGVLSPAKFLNIMENTGDIVWVGKWQLENICTQLNKWRTKFPDQDFFISMNLSIRQLTDENLVSDFTSIIKKYRIAPSNICIEVVEFAMFERYSNVTDVINKLHNIGFKIAIDDFSLDGNSLGRLSTLPVDIIKVEKNFVENARSNFMMDKIVHMLVAFAKEQNKIVVAEGVENLDVLAEVMNYEITTSQGYLFSRPLPQAEFEKYIEDGSFKDAIKNAELKQKDVAMDIEEKIITSDDELSIPNKEQVEVVQTNEEPSVVEEELEVEEEKTNE